MAQISFETAEALIYDPVPLNRNASRTTLYSLGFRHIEAVGSLETFWSQVRRRPPDIALCEAQGNREMSDTIQQLRQGANGHNPFIVIIVTAWENTNGLVDNVLNSGADDLILRPFSTATLGARIRAHVERRKGFVVTTDYVGPDRRRDANRPSNIDLFFPPNSLKMKALDRLPVDVVNQRLEMELKVACDVLHSEKLRRDAFQICVLWRLIQGSLPSRDASNPDLKKLKRLTQSVEKRCIEQDIGMASDWCQSVQAAIEGIEHGVDRNASLHLLGHAALNLNQLFAPEKSANDHLTQIDATVAIIHARAETALAS